MVDGSLDAQMPLGPSAYESSIPALFSNSHSQLMQDSHISPQAAGSDVDSSARGSPGVYDAEDFDEEGDVDASGVILSMGADDRASTGAVGGGKVRTKLYRCPREHCTKVYKNANGLKYHKDKGQCEVDFHPQRPLPAPGAAIKITHRPYWCKMPSCGKRYKNLNGLKYHAKAAHPLVDFKQLKGHVALG
ncbi:hypothetical protein HK097_000132 [Rhizophlyctis rosea]|uniref:C2H2-type domain-containing protein n=1 Tax=Rhizophlyctis rosea TaxID=64517 RepID=A0AAD5SGP4_9FUNG|nr:hypothetical protein HK097_000132 [Rhizophlyctis rosea]